MKSKKFLSDLHGNLSSMRLVFAVCSILVIVVWAWLSLANSRVEDIPMGLSAVISALAVGKAGQSWVEHKPDSLDNLHE